MSLSAQQILPVERLFQELRSKGIQLRAEGGDLRVSAPQGAMTADLRDVMRRRKAELLVYLQAGGIGSTPGTDAPLVRVSRNRELPLSFAQERMWILQQMAPTDSVYIVRNTSFLRAGMVTLQQAWNALLERHEILRTTYRMSDDGRPMQIIHEPRPAMLPVVDLSDVANTDLAREVRDRAREFVQMPFDLGQGPVWRLLVYQLRDGILGVALCIHHIASDDWSITHLIKELNELCAGYGEGREPRLAPLPVQYADYAVWQRQWLRGERLERELVYWRERLAGMAPVLELPTDYPRPAIQTSGGSGYRFDLPRLLSESIIALGQRHRVTPFMTLLTVFKVLLYRYSGQSDIVVGVPIAGRDRAEVEHVQGLFLNTLLLRTEVSGDLRFSELLARVRETTLGAYAHQELPFEKLVEELHPERNLSSNPLFQCLFNKLLVPPADQKTLEDDTPGPLDLALTVHETVGVTTLVFTYKTDLFRRETIERMAGHFLKVAEAVARDVEQPIKALPLLASEERDELLKERNRTQQTLPGDPVSRLFEEQVQRLPRAIALVFGEEQLSYGELNARANRLAHYLRSMGVGREVKVGVLLERGVQMLVAVLGVIKAGGAYVPLDPSYPEERVVFMLQDSEAGVLLTEERLLAGMPAGSVRVVCVDRDAEAIAQQSGDDLKTGPVPSDLAYMIYTSGSTGQPKGVQIEHRALSNFLQSMVREPGLGQHDVLVAVTTLSFDIAGLELYLPLISGARLVLAGREVTTNGIVLAELLESSEATVVQATPATWRLLRVAGWQGGAQLKILCGGEALPRDLAEQLLGCCGELWNMYGPTETTIWSTAYRVQPGAGAVPIGRPIANTRLYIVDANLQPVPAGVAGELYIGGIGVARGYWKRESLNAERFVADVFSAESGACMYRTGDLVRYLPDGNLEFVGRIDNQVKVRGFRIELGEIEAVLNQQPQVREAVVVVREDVPGDKRLVAYVVVEGGGVELIERLREQLRASLPDYMMPSAFVTLEGLPLTPNGKVDRKALPAVSSNLHPGESYVSPETHYECVLASVWCEVLHMDRVSLHDNFFDIGGHSLLAIESIVKFKERTGRSLDPRHFYQQTLGQLAASLDGAADATRKATTSGATAIELQPFFFGVDGRRLYGLLRVASSSAGLGVVLCQPHAHEYIRCHRAFRELGQRLAWAGIPVLSFDYYGTGDSGGDYQQGTISGWVADVGLAIDALKQEMKVERVCLVGLRLGATLAMMAGAGRRDLAGIAAWDPIVAGADVEREIIRIEELQALDTIRQRDIVYQDVLSYPLTPHLAHEIRQIDLCPLLSPDLPAILVLESEREDSGRRFADQARTQGVRVDFQCIDEARIWLREPYEAIVPRNSMKALVSWISAWLP